MEKSNKKNSSVWPSILLSASIVISLFTFGFYMFKVFSNTALPDDTVKVVLYGILAPYILTTIALYMLKRDFEKVRNSFEETKTDLVEKFKEEIIKPLKIELVNAIKPTAHYNVIMNHEHKNILLKFIPNELTLFENRIAQMSVGHLYEYNPSKYHAFASSMFDLATEKIIATSVIDPTGFWDDPMALSYLNNNKRIVQRLENAGKHEKFIRYFFVNEETGTSNKAQSLQAIANNLVIGVKVYIIKDGKDFDEDYRIDACLIDDCIAVISKLDKRKKTMVGVDAYIDDRDKVPFIKDWADFLDANKVEVLDYYNNYTPPGLTQINSLDDIKKFAKTKLKDGSK